ncbi:uncharacterized protein LOC117340320 isoform X2 [Pecten maximus]|uniref:uncharacterized protein LOC117340320 isoform X2 n=1 Tax=Pecten maximus TaxID=6579 RepID=UPI00145902C0|nr:uncharacterized protein LOC117340320 isoform X2 [Pecten maximus]
MSSTGVLGQHPNTIDMAPGHGSIVDGVNAEVLLNSNANLHGVINSKDSKRYRPANGNSVLHSSKLENTKNRAPYQGFRTSGTDNDIHFGEISLKVKSVNAEARPLEEAEVGGPGNVVPGSNNSVKNSEQTQKGDVSNGKYSNNGNTIDQNVGRTNVNKATINTGNKRVKTDTKNVQSSIDSSSASTINPVVHTESSAKSESNTNPSQKESNTKPSTQSKSSSTARSQTRVAQQTVSGTIGQQTARGARIQHQAQRRIQRPTQGGFGTPWRGGVDGGGVWKAAARNEARELVLEKEGHWNSLSHGIKDRKTTHFSNRRRLV